MTLRVPPGFFERCWDGSDGGTFRPGHADLPTHGTAPSLIVPPFDLLISSSWRPMELAVGPRLEVSVVLDETAVGPILASLVVSSKTVSVTVGRGVAPDVLVRLSAPDLLRVRAGHLPFLDVFRSSDSKLDGDDAALLYLAGLFDDGLWTRAWGLSQADLDAASALIAVSPRRVT